MDAGGERERQGGKGSVNIVFYMLSYVIQIRVSFLLVVDLGLPLIWVSVV